MRRIVVQDKDCLECGVVISDSERGRSDPNKWESRKFCSVKCRISNQTGKKQAGRIAVVSSALSREKTPKLDNCLSCGIDMPTHRKSGKYCSRSCYADHKKNTYIKTREIMCETCGITFSCRSMSDIKRGRKFCSVTCARRSQMRAKYAWKGGRTIVSGGYVRVWVSPTDEMSCMCPTGLQSVLEHRLVVARSIGRPLLGHETVHHKNGIRDDNRIENLELRTGNHGVGATVHCPTCLCNHREDLPDEGDA